MFVATINNPGYLPNEIDPPTFDNVQDAWSYLAAVQKDNEDFDIADGIYDEYSEYVNMLESAGRGTMDDYANLGLSEDGTGSIYVETNVNWHNLGLVYSVSEVEG